MIKTGTGGFGMWPIKCLAVLLVSVAAFNALAADDDDLSSTNRDNRPVEELFKTDLVYPQEKNELEAQVATIYQNRRDGDTWSIPLSLEYGLTDNWQVEAEWNSFVQHRQENGAWARGIGDLELGTQYSFMNIGGSLFHIAPRFSLELPLGDVNKDLSEGFIEYEPGVIVARDFPKWHHTQIFTELGASLVQRVKRPADADDAEAAAHELNLGSGFFTPVPFGVVSCEFNWNNNQWNHHGTENQLYVTPGVIWRIIKNVEVGVGIPIGLNRQSDRFDVSAHITCEF